MSTSGEQIREGLNEVKAYVAELRSDRAKAEDERNYEVRFSRSTEKSKAWRLKDQCDFYYHSTLERRTDFISLVAVTIAHDTCAEEGPKYNEKMA